MDIATTSAAPTAQDPLWRASQTLEAWFLEDFLRSAGVGKTLSVDGAMRDSEFSSFLRQFQAERLVIAGGIGLSEQLYAELKGSPHV